MIKVKDKILFIIAILIMSIAVIFTFLPIQNYNDAYAQSLTSLEDVDFNGATLLNDSNKYLKTNVYSIKDNTGYNASKGSASYPLKTASGKNGFARFYIETLGEGGEVYRGENSYKGFDSYGYVAGSGEAITDKDSKGNDITIGYNSIAIKMQYNYTKTAGILGKDGKYWEVSEDSWQKSINGINPVGVIGKGALIIQKFSPTSTKSYPTSSSDWARLNEYSNKETDGIQAVNFMTVKSPSSNKNPFIIYTPSGEDLTNGVFIKITFAYELRTMTYDGLFFDTYKYINVLETTSFYLCNTSNEIVFNNYYVYQDSDTGATSSDASSEAGSITERNGGALTDNQGSLDGFILDYRGNNFDIYYTLNDNNVKYTCEDGEVFSNPGKYVFYIKSKIGIVRRKTLYIHEKGEKNNFKIYFGDSLISSEEGRVFDISSDYPTYAKGEITIKTQDENANSSIMHAPLVGRVYRYDCEWGEIDLEDASNMTGELIAEKRADDKNWEFSDLPAGNYVAVFANNEDYFTKEISGDTFIFTWKFTVAEAGEKPSVNEQMIYTQVGVNDYSTLNYVVKLKSQGVGNILILFSEEDDAYDYACRYLNRSVTVVNEKYYYNENEYNSEKEMLKALQSDAKKLVEKHYFDTTDSFSYLTIDLNNINSESSEIQSLFERELQYDVLVFTSESAMDKATTEGIFLNDRLYATLDSNGKISKYTTSLMFVSVATYESASVVLYHTETGLEYKIPYGISVQTYLDNKNAPSGLYKIKETNHFGTSEYYATYVRPEDFTMKITIERSLNEEVSTHTFEASNAGIVIDANSITFVEVENLYDDYGLIKIYKGNSLIIKCEFSELEELETITATGKYKLELIDRLGKSETFYFNIFSLEDKVKIELYNDNDLVKKAFANCGDVIELPKLTSNVANLMFAGWKDEEGKVYTSFYNVNYFEDIKLTAYWKYKKVKVSIYNGDLIQDYSCDVGELLILPSIEVNGFELFGYCWEQTDGSKIFYRGQITEVPNEDLIRLDAVWIKPYTINNFASANGEEVAVSLVDGELIECVTVNKNENFDLSTIVNDNMEFGGWMYLYGLKGYIYTDEFIYQNAQNIGMLNENSITLIGVWKVSSTNEGAIGGITNNSVPMSEATSGVIETSAKIIGIICGILLFAVIAIVLKKKLSKKQKATEKVLENIVETEKVETKAEEVFVKVKKKNTYKFKRFAFKKIFVKVAFPCLLILMAVMTFIDSQQGLCLAVSSYVNESKCEIVVEESTSKEVDEEDLYTTVINEKLEEYSIITCSQEIGAENTYKAAEEITTERIISDDKLFLESSVMIDLESFGFTDIFYAYANVGTDTETNADDKTYYGIGYTCYCQAEEVGEDIYFYAGFVSFEDEGYLTEDEIATGVVIERDEDYGIADYNQFKLEYDYTWGPYEYVAFEKYVQYYVQNYTIFYKITIDTGKYEGDTDVFNYDTNEYCHYSSYGDTSDIDFYSINSSEDYNDFVTAILDILTNQDTNVKSINIEKANYISMQALNDYISNNQNEKLLGLSADEILYYEAHTSDTQYYVLLEDGTIDILDLPPEEEPADLWKRIAVAVAAAGGVVLGVLCAAIPFAGPFVAGAIVGATMDIFMQIISGTKVEDINLWSVLASGVVGVVTAGIGSATASLTKSVGEVALKSAIKAGAKATAKATAKIAAKLGIKALSGAFIGTSSYLIRAGITQQNIEIEDLLKSVATGALTSCIVDMGSNALTRVANKWSTTVKNFAIIGIGAASGAVSYELARLITGEEFSVSAMLASVGMGVLVAGSSILGDKFNKDIQHLKEKRALSKLKSSKATIIDVDDAAQGKTSIAKELNIKEELTRRSKSLPGLKKSSKWQIVDPDNPSKVLTKEELIANGGNGVAVLKSNPNIKIQVKECGLVYGDDLCVSEVKLTKLIDSNNRNKNFDDFDDATAQIWSNGGAPDEVKSWFEKQNIDVDKITKDSVKNYRTANKLVWHECSDGMTGQLIPKQYHNVASGGISHAGGISYTKLLNKKGLYDIINARIQALRKGETNV